MLEINNLTKCYGDIVGVSNLTLKLNDGEIFGFIGPNGAGKSTTIKCIMGIINKTKGEIKFRENKNKIGYMFQNDCLFPWLTILDNCLIGLKIQKQLTKENIEYVKKLLTNYGLKDFINSYPSNLSGGMKQRVALIRTLATKPDILLLDEPFSALDYQSRLSVADDVYKIIKKEKKTTIVITHDVAEAIY